MSLPVLDLSLFTVGGPEERQKLAYELSRCLLDNGFVKLKNHGISETMVAQMLDWNHRFFRLDSETKTKIAHQPGPNPQRGFCCEGSENTAKIYSKVSNSSVVTQTDAKEHFDMGPPGDLQFPNKWPDDAQLPGFRSFLESCFDRFETVTRSILEALEVGLGLELGTFNDLCTHESNGSEFRLLHYKSISVADMKRRNRISPHFDLGVITLLFQDNVGGLEMENRKNPGTFLPVEPSSPADMVVNIAETFQRWTNNTLRAGLHRVTLPGMMGDVDTIPERYSITYFSKADRSVSVAPLAPFVSSEKAPVYDDMTALEYQQQRVLAAY